MRGIRAGLAANQKKGHNRCKPQLKEIHKSSLDEQALKELNKVKQQLIYWK